VSAVAQSANHELEQALAHYDIGELIDFEPAKPVPDNHSYHAHTRQGEREFRVTLTFVEPPALPTGAYVCLLDRCAAAGLPVAPILRTKKGLPYATTSSLPAFVVPRLSGRITYNPTERQIRALGRFAARFHLATASAEYLMPDHPGTVSWLRGQEQSLRGLMPFAGADMFVEAARCVRSLLRRHDVNELPSGAIHTRLARANALFNEAGLTGVLNLDQAAQGFLIYDLAAAANDWCNDASGALNPERTLWLLQGYHAIRPLTHQEVWFFSGFALYAALNAWVAQLSQVSTAREPFKNPDELEAAVRHHLGHTFYIDHRLLA